jgi:hypothetical protein
MRFVVQLMLKIEVLRKGIFSQWRAHWLPLQTYQTK